MRVAVLGEINVALQSLLTGLSNQSKQIRAFQLCALPADQNDQAEMWSPTREREKIVSITRYHDASVLLRGGEDYLIGGISWQHFGQPRDFVAVACKNVFDCGGNVVVEKELHFSGCSI
jgi:hypothetical protein